MEHCKVIETVASTPAETQFRGEQHFTTGPCGRVMPCDRHPVAESDGMGIPVEYLEPSPTTQPKATEDPRIAKIRRACARTNWNTLSPREVQLQAAIDAIRDIVAAQPNAATAPEWDGCNDLNFPNASEPSGVVRDCNKRCLLPDGHAGPCDVISRDETKAVRLHYEIIVANLIDKHEARSSSWFTACQIVEAIGHPSPPPPADVREVAEEIIAYCDGSFYGSSLIPAPRERRERVAAILSRRFGGPAERHTGEIGQPGAVSSNPIDIICFTGDVRECAQGDDPDLFTPATNAELLQLRTEIVAREPGPTSPFERVVSALIARIDEERERFAGTVAAAPPANVREVAEEIEAADLLFSGCGCKGDDCEKCGIARIELAAILSRFGVTRTNPESQPVRTSEGATEREPTDRFGHPLVDSPEDVWRLRAEKAEAQLDGAQDQLTTVTADLDDCLLPIPRGHSPQAERIRQYQLSEKRNWRRVDKLKATLGGQLAAIRTAAEAIPHAPRMAAEWDGVSYDRDEAGVYGRAGRALQGWRRAEAEALALRDVLAKTQGGGK